MGAKNLYVHRGLLRLEQSVMYDLKTSLCILFIGIRLLKLLESALALGGLLWQGKVLTLTQTEHSECMDPVHNATFVMQT